LRADVGFSFFLLPRAGVLIGVAELVPLAVRAFFFGVASCMSAMASADSSSLSFAFSESMRLRERLVPLLEGELPCISSAAALRPRRDRASFDFTLMGGEAALRLRVFLLERVDIYRAQKQAWSKTCSQVPRAMADPLPLLDSARAIAIAKLRSCSSMLYLSLVLGD